MINMEGKVLTGVFTLAGQKFMALDGGPLFKPNESVSFLVDCADQAEVDYFWDTITQNGGMESQCGWCKDKYGLSWQIVPVEYFELIHSEDPIVRDKALTNTFKMKKLILSELK